MTDDNISPGAQGNGFDPSYNPAAKPADGSDSFDSPDAGDQSPEAHGVSINEAKGAEPSLDPLTLSRSLALRNGVTNRSVRASSGDEHTARTMAELKTWVAAGYLPNLIPLLPGDKKSLDQGWQKNDYTEAIAARVANGANVGLRLGDIIAVDIEGSSLGDDLARVMDEEFPFAPVRSRSGSASKLYLLRYAGDVAFRWEIPVPPGPPFITHENPKGGKVVEVLTSGQAHILGTRKDKNDARLVWSHVPSVDDLPAIDADALSALGERMLSVMREKGFSSTQLARSAYARRSGGGLIISPGYVPDHLTEEHADLLREALAAIPRDASFLERDARVHMCHAVWGATLGADWGRDLFLEWDGQMHPDNNVGDPGRAERAWERLNRGERVRAGAGHIRKLLEDRGQFALRDRLNSACAMTKFVEKIEAAKEPECLPPDVNVPLEDIPGGVFQPDDMMREISARFSVVDFGKDVCIVHRDRDNVDHILTVDAFGDKLANVWVSVGTAETPKMVLAATWWRRHVDRPPTRKAVFKTGASPIALNEYNFWRGYGVNPGNGTDKIRRFMKHLWVIICRRNRKSFRYLLKWMAWVIQNPDKQAETVVILRSETGGTGKTSVSRAMRKLFGSHALVISNPDHLFGSHSGEGLEHTCFVALEEALFAGNRAQSDKCKDLVTGDTLLVNPKFRRAYSIPNRLSAMFTTNHDWAVDTGKDGRRWFVLDVDESKASDKSWFDPLYADLNNGGYEQLLGFLLRINLKGWHPRDLERTDALAKQQVQSATGVAAWLLECASEGSIPRYNPNGTRDGLGPHNLGEAHTNDVLRASLAGYRKEVGARWDTPTSDAFGKTMRKILGMNRKRENLPNAHGGKGRGFYMPTQCDLRRALEAHLSMGPGELEKVQGN